MKLLILQICEYPSGGGAELIAYKLSELIKGEELESYGIFFKKANDSPTIKENQFVLGTLATKNITIYYRLLKKILKLSKGHSKVIIHCHLWKALYLIVPLSYFKKFILFYTEHNSTNNRRKYFFLKPLEKFVYGRYKKIISISPHVKIELLKWLDNKNNKLSNTNKKFSVIYNGFCKYKFIKRKLKKEKYNIISIGSLTKQKGFETTIKAVKYCKGFVNSYLILGKGPEKNTLEKIISDEKLKDTVKLVGYKKNIIKYLKNSDLGLIPSKWEGFGLVSLEMISSGLPLCISNVKGMKGILKGFNTVRVIDSFNEKDWAKAIKASLKALPSKKYEINYSAMETKKYSLEKMIQNYKNEYLKYK